MKRAFALLAVAAMGLLSALQAPAADFGIIGGYTSSKTKLSEWAPKNANGYHIGMAVNVPLVAGLALQPQVTYQVKKSEVSGWSGSENMNKTASDAATSVGFIEGGIQLQWGPDLLLFRPYVFAEPFVGYALNAKTETSGVDGGQRKTISDAIHSLEYGLGLGGGLEIGRFQLSAKYFWNFGDLYDGDELNEVSDVVRDAFKEQKSFQGVCLTLGIFF